MSNDARRKIVNGSVCLEALSELMPDTDPSVLMATVDEFCLIADSARRLRELGTVRLFQFGAVLENAKEIQVTAYMG